MKYDIPGERRWEDPPQRIGEPDSSIRPSTVLRFIDTRHGSLNNGYVMQVNSSALTFAAAGYNGDICSQAPSRPRSRRP